jgi:hypothetical protein
MIPISLGIDFETKHHVLQTHEENGIEMAEQIVGSTVKRTGRHARQKNDITHATRDRAASKVHTDVDMYLDDVSLHSFF